MRTQANRTNDERSQRKGPHAPRRPRIHLRCTLCARVERRRRDPNIRHTPSRDALEKVGWNPVSSLEEGDVSEVTGKRKNFKVTTITINGNWRWGHGSRPPSCIQSSAHSLHLPLKQRIAFTNNVDPTRTSHRWLQMPSLVSRDPISAHRRHSAPRPL